MSKTTCTIEIDGITVSYVHETLSNSLPGLFTIPGHIVRAVGMAVFKTDVLSHGTDVGSFRETTRLSDKVFKTAMEFYMTAGVIRADGVGSFLERDGAVTKTGMFTMVADYSPCHDRKA